MQGCGPPRCRDLLSAAWWRPAAQTQWVPSVSEITVSASETPGRCSTPSCRVNSRNAFNERGGHWPDFTRAAARIEPTPTARLK